MTTYSFNQFGAAAPVVIGSDSGDFDINGNKSVLFNSGKSSFGGWRGWKFYFGFADGRAFYLTDLKDLRLISDSEKNVAGVPSAADSWLGATVNVITGYKRPGTFDIYDANSGEILGDDVRYYGRSAQDPIATVTPAIKFNYSNGLLSLFTTTRDDFNLEFNSDVRLNHDDGRLVMSKDSSRVDNSPYFLFRSYELAPPSEPWSPENASQRDLDALDNDLIIGDSQQGTGNGPDVLTGTDLADRIYGKKGKDVIKGGPRGDLMSSGRGEDLFVYQNIADSLENDPDYITDFNIRRDKIDLSEIDADVTSTGNQSFDFIGRDSQFSMRPGELRAVRNALEGDVNGDGSADFIVMIENARDIGLSNLVL